MSSIQEIRQLEDEIYDIVNDYLRNNYCDEDTLVVTQKGEDVELAVAKHDEIQTGNSCESYSLRDLIRQSEEGGKEPDIDRISDIANEWLFLD